MISYYGYTISPNQLETGEGFLICRNVPIARTGTQEYIGREIGLDTDDIIEVNRPESEVFSDAAMASFEGKPITNDHPTELVTPDTATIYEKGHAQNIRRGSGEFDGYLIADLHIHDATLIDAVKNGKRQISCGYECEYVEEDGTYSQVNIRGNHIAVVDEGRAGAKAAIMDSNTAKADKAERTVKMSKKSTFLKLFGMAANGKSPEELTQLALDSAEALDEVKAEDAEAAEEVSATDIDPIAEVNAKLDKLIELMTAKAMDAEAPEVPEAPETKDAEEVKEELKAEIDAAIEELTATEGAEELGEGVAEAESEEARVVPAEEMDACKDEEKALDNAIASHILKSVRESVAGITDETQRKAVSDAIIGAVKANKSDIASVIDAQSTFVTKTTNIEDIQAAYDAMNPHKKSKGV